LPSRLEPVNRALLALVAFGALSRLLALGAHAEERRPSGAGSPLAATAVASSAALSAPCPPGTLPDGGVCVPVPSGELGGEALTEQKGFHHDRKGRLRIYDQIPRRPERPADYRRYVLPIPPLPGQSFVSSGYDLDQPDEEQRRGAELSAVGHGGIDLAQKRHTKVSLVALENQAGDASVLYVGKLFGNSVVTQHALREGGALRDYLVIYGHLEGPAPGLRAGATLPPGALVGFVGDSGSPGVVHLHLEVRRAREGVSLASLGAGQLTQNAKTVACDPRNVLKLL
jgi:murein DD-endopeptidase MepM/ murein hydrolase activator NlpD